MKRAVLYARSSGDDRAKEGRNLRGQLEMCQRYAREHDYQVVAELAEDDLGASGAVFDLPEMNRALNMAKAGEFDVLIVRELDRFARGLAKQLIVEQEFQRNGVQVEYVLDDYDDTPEGQLQKHVKAVIAEYERLKTRQRTMRVRRSMVKDGKIVLSGGRPPYGYRLSEDKTTLDPYEPEARIVRMIFQWYTVERLSSVKIAQRLSDMKVPTWTDTHDSGLRVTKKRAWGEWSPATVLAYLHSELYRGIWHYGKRRTKSSALNSRDRWIPLEVTPLVSEETWKKAQRQSKRNRIMARRNNKYPYLMRYRLTCQICGRAIGAQTTKDRDKLYPYYVCLGRLNHKTSAGEKCELPRFRADHVDETVWGWVKSFLTDPVALAKGLQAEQAEREEVNRPLHERLAVVDDLLADNHRQLERALDLYLSGDFPKEMLVERQERLQKTIEALERERTGLVAQLEAQTFTDEQVRTVTEFAQRVAQGLDRADASFEARRRVIEVLDVWATLAEEDGQKVVYTRCILGEDALSVAPTDTSSGRTGSPGGA